MPDLPSGTVTFLFTDVEGSTRLLHELGAEGYAVELAEHRRILRGAFDAHAGVEVDTQGDAFFVAFPTAPGALSAAAASLDGLAGGPISVRIGLHTGTPLLTEEGYVGEDVHRAARIAACGHGGQILVSTSTAALVDSDVLHDLGEHRLKDLSAPERIYQLGDGEFPALKSLYRTNLPVPATPFLGRDQELADVLALLTRDDVRLLTLTGPGGTGKTRLALQAAAEASDDYPDGVFWVPLAPLRDPALVLEEAARAVGASDSLAEHIGDKQLLLLLDNFEHLLDAAAELAGPLAACPNLQVVVTSRELLQLPGEQTYPVPPLADDDGIRLFTARAQAVKPEFTANDTVAEICRRLDDLPLALELAAARVRALSPEQLLERLGSRLDLLKAGRGTDPRQQTLRATIEWSHDLLTEDERRLFAHLAVFRGGCTLEAAEHICDADLDTLQSLVDKSLLRHNEERYWMLETIREYATEKLDESDHTDDIRDRHAEHFLLVAEDAEPFLRRESTLWLNRMESEHDNVRAAIERFEASGESYSVLRLAAAVWWFWSLRDHFLEGRRRLEGALAGDQRPTAARARALSGVADLAGDVGDHGMAIAWAEEALALNRSLGDAWGTAYAALTLGFAVEDSGDIPRARELFDESARLFRELGDQHYTLLATRPLAGTSYFLGDLATARALYEDILTWARAESDESIEKHSLGALAMIAVDQGRVNHAVSMLREAHPTSDTRAEPGLQQVYDLCRFAYVLAHCGRSTAAARLLSLAEARFVETGAAPRPFLVQINDRTLATLRTQLREEALGAAADEGAALTVDEALALALEALPDA